MRHELKIKDLGSVPIMHGTLLSMLKEYRSPNDKIVRLIDEGWLIPIKKGMYAVSPERTALPLSMPLIANLLYGPSYVSMDFALFYYGIIPERVVEVTSMTIRRGKAYSLPIGRFSYTHSRPDFYQIGIERIANPDKSCFLMASPEKALCDKLVFTRNLKISSMNGLMELLFDDLRVDEDLFTRFDPKVIEACLMSGLKVNMLQTLLRLVNSMKRNLL
ncbi:MAG: hypothetical protein WCG19_02035 [Chlorobiaceae bacterium]